MAPTHSLAEDQRSFLRAGEGLTIKVKDYCAETQIYPLSFGKATWIRSTVGCCLKEIKNKHNCQRSETIYLGLCA